MSPGPFHWTDTTVRRALGLEEVDGSGEISFNRISTDTRTLSEGDLFIALEGPNYDGHDFLSEAAVQGARAAVVSRPASGQEVLPLYPVPDTLVALGQLARFRRRSLAGTVIALTGSSGKTTVKDLLQAILGAQARVHATSANLNNRVGVPLTLLDTPDDAEFVVVELGTNQSGEIATLTRITEPDLALVTTVGEGHLEGLESLDGVLREKLALLVHLRPGAPAFVGDTPIELPQVARTLREDVQVVGFTHAADPRWRGHLGEPDERGRISFQFRDHSIHPGLPGHHGAQNCLLALSLGDALGLSMEEMVPAVEGAAPGRLRGEWLELGSLALILDCYNANPQSIRSALSVLRETRWDGPKIAVLGSMLELGDHAGRLHQELLTEAVEGGLDLLLAIGLFQDAAQALGWSEEGEEGPRAESGQVRVLTAADAEEGWERLAPHLTGSELILLKGSRGVRLEEMVPHFRQSYPAQPDGSTEPGQGSAGTGQED